MINHLLCLKELLDSNRQRSIFFRIKNIDPTKFMIIQQYFLFRIKDLYTNREKLI